MKQRLVYLVAGIAIGMFLASYLAYMAAQRRDALLISTYEGSEGYAAIVADHYGDALAAYVHAANDVAVMQNGRKLLGMDAEPWTIWTPYSSLWIAMRAGYPTGTWSKKTELGVEMLLERRRQQLMDTLATQHESAN